MNIIKRPVTISNWRSKFDMQLQYLKSIPQLNYGGCAIAAFALYNWFKKHNLVESLNVKLIYGYYHYSESCYTINNNFLQNETDNLKSNESSASSCSHAFLEVDGEFYDSSGNISADIDYSYMHEVSDLFVFYTIMKFRWNTTFDRDQFMPKIFKRFNVSKKNWEAKLVA